MTDIPNILQLQENIFTLSRISPSEVSARVTVTPASAPLVRRETTRVNVVTTRAESCVTRAVPCTISDVGPPASTSPAMSASAVSVMDTRTNVTLIRRLSQSGKVRTLRENIPEAGFASIAVTRLMESIVKNVFQDTFDLREFLSSVEILAGNVHVTLPEVKDRKFAIPIVSCHTRVTRQETACVGKDSPELIVIHVRWDIATTLTASRVLAHWRELSEVSAAETVRVRDTWPDQSVTDVNQDILL